MGKVKGELRGSKFEVRIARFELRRVEVISHAKSAKSAEFICPITLALEGSQLHATEGAEI